MATTILFGVTGTIGPRVFDEALRRGRTVTVVVRDRKPDVDHLRTAEDVPWTAMSPSATRWSSPVR